MSAVDNLKIKKYVAELVGTFILVLAGCGSAVFAGNYIGSLGISFAFGLSALVMVYTIGSISGCHINPAVSISMLFSGKLGAKDTVFYIVSQCVGAIIGAGAIYGIIKSIPFSSAVTNLAQNGYGGSSSLIAAAIAEVVFTFVFVLVVHGATSKKAPKGFAGIAIGFALTLVHLCLIPITNASVNPARSLGPALFVGGAALEQLWLFWLAPIIGGLLAAVVWKIINDPDDTEQTVKAEDETNGQLDKALSQDRM